MNPLTWMLWVSNKDDLAFACILLKIFSFRLALAVLSCGAAECKPPVQVKLHPDKNLYYFLTRLLYFPSNIFMLKPCATGYL